MTSKSDVRIRKVKVLTGISGDIANNMNLSDDDLVILRTSVELIEGSPIEYLQNKLQEDEK